MAQSVGEPRASQSLSRRRSRWRQGHFLNFPTAHAPGQRAAFLRRRLSDLPFAEARTSVVPRIVLRATFSGNQRDASDTAAAATKGATAMHTPRRASEWPCRAGKDGINQAAASTAREGPARVYPTRSVDLCADCADARSSKSTSRSGGSSSGCSDASTRREFVAGRREKPNGVMRRRVRPRRGLRRPSTRSPAAPDNKVVQPPCSSA